MTLFSESNELRLGFPRMGISGAAYRLQSASNLPGDRLDPGPSSVEYRVQQPMKKFQATFFCLCLTAAILMAGHAAAQNPPPANSPAPPSPDEQLSRVTIEVSGGEKDVPVENASVYVKYIEERKLKKDQKLELNIKTNREGIAHVANTPRGRVLIQVVAEGWKTYGRWYDITDAKQTFKVHLQRPPKWY
jgi:hypothetical protein